MCKMRKPTTPRSLPSLDFYGAVNSRSGMNLCPSPVGPVENKEREAPGRCYVGSTKHIAGGAGVALVGQDLAWGSSSSS